MDNSYRPLDLTLYGRQEWFEDSPAGWPQRCHTEIDMAPRKVAGASDHTVVWAEFDQQQGRLRKID
jgi:hypothetical protein